MTEIPFKRPELADREIITHYFEHHTSRSCERTFANVYLWSRQYPVTWAVVEDALVFKSEDETHLSYAYPAGEPQQVKKALEVLKKGEAFPQAPEPETENDHADKDRIAQGDSPTEDPAQIFRLARAANC